MARTRLPSHGDRPDAGYIAVGGHRLEQLKNPARYRANIVGFVFQFHNLITTLNALENVQIPLLGKKLSRKEREQRARELLTEVGLEHRLDAYPGTLSGGERQRVAIARALVNRPCLLLADEPTGSLDSVTGEMIMAQLKGLRDQHQMTILVVTNDLATAAVGDRTLRMRDGRVETVDDPPTPAAAPRSG